MRCRLTGSVKGTLSEASLEAGLKGSLSLQEREQPLAAILGGKIAFDGRLILKQGRELAFPEMRLSAAAGTLAGSGFLDPVRLLWNGAFQIRIPDLRVLAPVAGTALAGSSLVDARMEGSPETTRLNADIRGEEILFGALRVGKVSLTLDAGGTPLRNTGAFHAALGEDLGGTTGKARFTLAENRLSFSEILISGPGRTQAEGDLWFDLGTSLGEGALRGRCEDLSAVSLLLGERIRGNAEFTAEMSAREKAQQVTISIKGAHLDTAFGKAETLELQARLRDVMEGGQGERHGKDKGFPARACGPVFSGARCGGRPG